MGYFSHFPFFLFQQKVERIDSRYALFYHIVSTAAESKGLRARADFGRINPR